ncbi:MAG TPA: phosphocarrier protein HPr [Acholeplasmataceae bacterium]|jgi:phosphocarrier protein|nr:phosphocarrier protein HPr [Acholeplasmataceae bacterium]HPX72153.1 phosphocarrier protein HPr [Acholeplasmataceae bacterium]HQC30971.1 phosphocarrier protein HPr [Acholeplasmataceae bacterium]
MEKTFLIIAEYGIHARPATRLVNEAMKYESEILMESMGKTVNLKSIMGVMSLGIYRGENVKIKITGPDQEKAMEGIVNFLTSEGLGSLV